MKKGIYKLPSAFIERIETYYGPRSVAILNSFDKLRQTTFRINRLKTNPHDFRQYMKKQLIHAERVPWYEDAFVLTKPTQRDFQEKECYKEGWVYLQNLSSMVPPLILDPQPGEKILDLCAAPGSKTTQIASMTENQAEIMAVEKIKPRFYRLKANCELLGAKVNLVLNDGSRAVREHVNYFDRVLVDAPCSSEGQFSTHRPKSYAYWSPRKVQEMKHKQKRLIAAGWRSLKPGGTMVYSTCTYSPQENENVMSYLLKKYGDEIDVQPLKLPFKNSLRGFTSIDERPMPEVMTRTRRILPTVTMEGFYIAKLRKKE